MKKQIFISILILFIISCIKCKSDENNSLSQPNNSGNSRQVNTKPIKTEKMKLIEKIKQRTKRDLKKYGLKNFLLSGNGEWTAFDNSTTYFENNGKVMHKGVRISSTKGVLCLWKVVNEKLYLSYTVTRPNFVPTTVMPSDPVSYTLPDIDSLKYCKYSCTIKTKDGKRTMFLHRILSKKVVD